MAKGLVNSPANSLVNCFAGDLAKSLVRSVPSQRINRDSMLSFSLLNLRNCVKFG